MQRTSAAARPRRGRDGLAAAVGDTGAMTDDAPAVPKRLYWFILVLAVVVILADQGTKIWAEAALGDGQFVPVLGDVLGLVLVYNTGAAFSLGAGYTWVLAVLAGLAAVLIGWYGWRVRSWPWAIAFGLVLGGAITHFGDRVFRGKVVDFIAYWDWFVGNVADIAIVGGAVLAAVLALLQLPIAGGKRPRAEVGDSA